MKMTQTKNVLNHRWESLADFAQFQLDNQHLELCYRSFSGVDSIAEAVQLAKSGLPADGIKVLATSKHLTETAMRQVVRTDMTTTYDVSGSYVDMGRFVEGTPECMVSPTFDEMTVTAPVVTIVSNVNASGDVSKDDLEKRGRLVVALIKAIETSGRSTELLIDSTNNARRHRNPDYIHRISVMIKRASQPLDMGAVMYAFTHPSMLRVLCFNAMHQIPREQQGYFGVGAGYGCVEQGGKHVEESYGDDVVYLPAVHLWGDKAEETVKKVLKDLGIA